MKNDNKLTLEKVEEVIDKLIEGTKTGKLNWNVEVDSEWTRFSLSDRRGKDEFVFQYFERDCFDLFEKYSLDYYQGYHRLLQTDPVGIYNLTFPCLIEKYKILHSEILIQKRKSGRGLFKPEKLLSKFGL